RPPPGASPRAPPEGTRRHRPQPRLEPARLVPGRGLLRRQPDAKPLPLRRSQAGRLAAQQLDLLLRRPGLVSRAARQAVVPTPVLARAAGPELVRPGGP